MTDTRYEAFRAQVLVEFARYANKHGFTGTHKPMNRLGFTDEEIEAARANDAADDANMPATD